MADVRAYIAIIIVWINVLIIAMKGLGLGSFLEWSVPNLWNADKLPWLFWILDNTLLFFVISAFVILMMYYGRGTIKAFQQIFKKIGG